MNFFGQYGDFIIKNSNFAMNLCDISVHNKSQINYLDIR